MRPGAGLKKVGLQQAGLREFSESVPMDRMTAMVTFVKVIEAGGFAAAGRKLGISPSTVTTQIQTLEERLGTRLLNRSTRRVSLSEIGKTYHERRLTFCLGQ